MSSAPRLLAWVAAPVSAAWRSRATASATRPSKLAVARAYKAIADACPGALGRSLKVCVLMPAPGPTGARA